MIDDKDVTLYTKINEILNSDESAIDSMMETWVQGGSGYNMTYDSSSVGDSTSITLSSANITDYNYYYSSLLPSYKVSSNSSWLGRDYFRGYPSQALSSTTTLHSSYSFSFPQNVYFYTSKKIYSWGGGFQLSRMCCGGSMAVVSLIGKTWMQVVLDLYNQAISSPQKKQLGQDLCFAFSICFAKIL